MAPEPCADPSAATAIDEMPLALTRVQLGLLTGGSCGQSTIGAALIFGLTRSQRVCVFALLCTSCTQPPGSGRPAGTAKASDSSLQESTLGDTRPNPEFPQKWQAASTTGDVYPCKLMPSFYTETSLTSFPCSQAAMTTEFTEPGRVGNLPASQLLQNHHWVPALHASIVPQESVPVGGPVD